MIRYYVTPYQEEILYSQLARLFDHTLENSVSSGLMKLFGNGNCKATIDLPNHLDALFDNYYYRFEDSVDAIIDKYTLYPFYEPFLKTSKRDRILALLKGTSSSLIHTIAGINTSRIGRSRYPKYCPQCILDSRTQARESYWLRIHQVPGVMVCPIHNVFIHDYIPSFEQLNHSMFIAAECLPTDALNVFSNKNNTLLKMSKLLEDVLTRKIFFDINTIDYKERLKRSVYMKGSLISYSTLIDDVVKRYGIEALRIYFPNYKSPLQWMPTVIRKPSACFDPVKHILLDNFTNDLTIAPQLFHDSTWDGPWKCANPICYYYQNSFIQKAEVFFDQSLKRTAALIKCDCGMVHKVTYVLKDGVKTQLIWIKDYGEMWKNKVLSYNSEGISIASIANRMQTSHGVISRFLNSKRNIELKDLKFQREILKNRNEWITLLKGFDTAKIVNAKKVNNKLYKWLFNNDPSWLRVTNKLYTDKLKRPELRLDWYKIDAELMSRISGAVDELNRSGFKGRITKNLISKLIKVEKNYTRINALKIPNTISLFEMILEPMDSYQLRRLNDSILELQERHEKLTISKIVRNSGLKKVDNRTVLEFVQNKVFKACS